MLEPKETADITESMKKMTVGWVYETIYNANQLGTYEIKQKNGPAFGVLKYSIEEKGICISASDVFSDGSMYDVNVLIQEPDLEDLIVCQEVSLERNTECHWFHQGSWVNLTIKILEGIEEKNEIALEQRRVRKEKELQERLDRYEKKYRLYLNE